MNCYNCDESDAELSHPQWPGDSQQRLCSDCAAAAWEEYLDDIVMDMIEVIGEEEAVKIMAGYQQRTEEQHVQSLQTRH